MKTPLQELIEWMEQNQYFIGNDLYSKQKELLEKERVEIQNAYFEGKMDSVRPNRGHMIAELYFKERYNETFNQNK